MHLFTFAFILTILKTLLKESRLYSAHPYRMQSECCENIWRLPEEKGWAEGRALALCKHHFLPLQACNINKEGGLMLDEKTAAQGAKGSSLRWEGRSAGIYCCT